MNVHDQIKRLLDKFKHLHAHLNTGEAVHPAEKELLLTYLDELKRLVSGFPEETVNSINATETPVATTEEPVTEKTSLTEVEEEEVEVVVETMVVAPEVEEKTMEAPKEFEVPPGITEKKSVAVSQPGCSEKPEADVEEVTSINDRFKGRTTELADKITGHTEKTLKGRLDLGQKFEFARELFDGDGDLLDRALRIINDCTSLEEAKAFVSDKIKTRFDWTGKEQHEEKLMNLLEWRFS